MNASTASLQESHSTRWDIKGDSPWLVRDRLLPTLFGPTSTTRFPGSSDVPSLIEFSLACIGILPFVSSQGRSSDSLPACTSYLAFRYPENYGYRRFHVRFCGGWPRLPPCLPVTGTTEGGPPLRILQGRVAMLSTQGLFPFDPSVLNSHPSQSARRMGPPTGLLV